MSSAHSTSTTREPEVILLTVAEACDRLRVSRSTIYQLIQRRQLRTIQIGSRRFVPASAITDLVDHLLHDGDDS